MKYIRTKDEIYEVDVLSIHYIGETHFSCWDIKHTRAFNEWHIIKQADTIEELICDDDILYIYDLYPDAVLVVEGNVKPFGYPTAVKLKEWLDYKPKFDLFIKDSKGNYIKRAKTNDKGALELL